MFVAGSVWGSAPTSGEQAVSKEDLKKSMQRVLEKHASGIMGRDLRRLYKEVGNGEGGKGVGGREADVEDQQSKAIR